MFILTTGNEISPADLFEGRKGGRGKGKKEGGRKIQQIFAINIFTLKTEKQVNRANSLYIIFSYSLSFLSFFNPFIITVEITVGLE